MEKTGLRNILEKLEALPTLPGVVVRLLQLTQEETCDASAIAEVIESDQTLTARMLQLVNSPTFGLKTEVTSVSRAVVVLGTSAVRNMALGLGVARVFPAGEEEAAFDPVDFWKHSLGVAICSMLLAERGQRYADKDEAFVAGLLHDLGKTALSHCMPKEFARAVELSRSSKKPLLQVERDELGFTHAEVGKWVAEQWSLPPALVAPIWLHHHPPGALSGTDFNAHLIALVQLADLLVRRAHIGSGGNDSYEDASAELLEEAGVSWETAEAVQEGLWKRVGEAAQLVDLDFGELDLLTEALQRANLELSSLNRESGLKTKVLMRRERRLKALQSLNLRLRPSQSMEEVLGLLAEVLRDGYGISHGAVFVADPVRQMLRGKSWRAGQAAQTFELRVDDGGAGSAAELREMDPLLRAVVTDSAVKFNRDTWMGRSILQPLLRHDLVVAPMVAEGCSVGQVVVDRRAEGGTADQADLGELQSFATAAALAVIRVRVTNELHRQSEDLASAVLKREQAHKQLLHSERLAAVGKMAAGAAHEINNPLAIISARAQMMKVNEEDPEKQKAFSIMIDQCTRASKILTDLMRFARPALPNRETAGVNGVVHEVVEMFSNRYKSKRINLVTQLGEGLPKVMLDRGQIQQVLVNFLINAEHAITPPGSVTLKTGLTEGGDYVQVSVADTGCGMAPDKLEHIFEPFFTTKEEGKGTGLGLSVAHGIIASHQGYIDVDSEEGKGTTFTIALPVAEDLGQAQEAPGGRQRSGGEARKRVLVVDDETQVRAVIAESLSQTGYLVEQADNGLSALDIVQNTALDLITLDIRMPRMDGMAMLRALRERWPRIPVIVITGLASEQELAAARELGVAVCMRKPFELDDLLRQVKTTLGESQKR